MSNAKTPPAWAARIKEPACFESRQQWNEWKASARICSFRGTPCTDCTPWYQEKMLAAQRCERPDTVFDLDDDGFIAGTHPTPQTTQAKTEAA